MMDAYFPIHDTLRPSVSTSATDEPWKLQSGTQTVFWLTAPATTRFGMGSSMGKPVSVFIIADHPEVAGLDRLRKFKGWSDNWDAEGAKGPCPSSIDFATQVFGLLSSYRTPDVTLGVDGNPMFLYGGTRRGEVIVTSDQTFDYFFDDDDGPDREDATLEGGFLPSDLIGYISSVA